MNESKEMKQVSLHGWKIQGEWRRYDKSPIREFDKEPREHSFLLVTQDASLEYVQKQVDDKMPPVTWKYFCVTFLEHVGILDNMEVLVSQEADGVTVERLEMSGAVGRTVSFARV